MTLDGHYIPTILRYIHVCSELTNDPSFWQYKVIKVYMRCAVVVAQ